MRKLICLGAMLMIMCALADSGALVLTSSGAGSTTPEGVGATAELKLEPGGTGFLMGKEVGAAAPPWLPPRITCISIAVHRGAPGGVTGGGIIVLLSPLLPNKRTAAAFPLTTGAGARVINQMIFVDPRVPGLAGGLLAGDTVTICVTVTDACGNTVTNCQNYTFTC